MQPHPLQSDPPSRLGYHINAADVLTYVDEGWKLDAVNGNAPLLAHAAVGTPLFGHIKGEAVQSVYRRLIERVRTGRYVTFTFRCDAPALRRMLEMRMKPLGDGGVGFETRTVFEVARERIPLLDPDVRRSADAMVMCPWCQRLQGAPWVELEDAMSRGMLTATDVQPTMVYALCPDDDLRFARLLED